MKAIYEITLKVKVFAPVDEITKDIKSNTELANDMGQMICDEATQTGAVANYEVLESEMVVV